MFNQRLARGFTLIDWKTAISEYYANPGCWPAIGNQANSKINGQTLGLIPCTNTNNDVSCHS